MLKFVSVFVLSSFLLWILPLGVFIKPSQEQLSCGGQRAICLCRHLDANSQLKTVGKILFQNSVSAQKDDGASGGSSHFFLTAEIYKQLACVGASVVGDDTLPHLNPFSKSIEHIPKV